MKVHRGDVVLVDYLFSDRTGSKIRPCVIVQNDLNNQRLNDTIVVAISSNTSRAAHEATQFIIEVASPPGRRSGLLFDSAVQCENMVTIDRKFIRRRIGSLLPDVMSKVDRCLKSALALN
jgi:mRNA interferase MazF